MILNNIVVFDLDGTLIQSSQFAYIANWDFEVGVYWDLTPCSSGVKVKIRPGVRAVLKQMSNIYHLAVYTHSYLEYANLVIEQAGLAPYFQHVFSNGDEVDGMKDLRVVLDRFAYDPVKDMQKILIVDDNSWCRQNDRLMLVPAYQGGDDDLFNKQFLKNVAEYFTI